MYGQDVISILPNPHLDLEICLTSFLRQSGFANGENQFLLRLYQRTYHVLYFGDVSTLFLSSPSAEMKQSFEQYFMSFLSKFNSNSKSKLPMTFGKCAAHFMAFTLAEWTPTHFLLNNCPLIKALRYNIQRLMLDQIVQWQVTLDSFLVGLPESVGRPVLKFFPRKSFLINSFGQ